METLSLSPMKKVIFVAGNSDTHVKLYLPILRILRAEKYADPSIVYTGNFPRSRRHGEITNETISSANDIVTDFFIYNPTEHPVNTSSIFQNLNLVRDYQRQIANKIDELNPDYIVIPNNKIFRNRFIYKYAAIKNIGIIVIQDTLNPGGFGNIGSYSFKVRAKIRFARLATYFLNSLFGYEVFGIKNMFQFNIGHKKVKVIAVWGANSRKIAITNGYKSSQIVETGSPRFDGIVKVNWLDKANALLQGLDLQPTSKKIVYLPSKGITDEYFTSRDEQIKIYELLSNIIDDLSNRYSHSIDLIIKLHRDEKIEVFNEILPNAIFQKLVVTQDDVLYPLLQGCDLAITAASTAGLEAILFSKPLITINTTGRPDFYNYASEGAATSVADLCELSAEVENLLFDPVMISLQQVHREKYILNETHTTDGNASIRIANLIANTIKGKS